MRWQIEHTSHVFSPKVYDLLPAKGGVLGYHAMENALISEYSSYPVRVLDVGVLLIATRKR